MLRRLHIAARQPAVPRLPSATPAHWPTSETPPGPSSSSGWAGPPARRMETSAPSPWASQRGVRGCRALVAAPAPAADPHAAIGPPVDTPHASVSMSSYGLSVEPWSMWWTDLAKLHALSSCLRNHCARCALRALAPFSAPLVVSVPGFSPSPLKPQPSSSSLSSSIRSSI